MLPNFLVIGAMKAGTTSLAQYLGSHPGIFMTTPKEPNFFGSIDGANWDRGLAWYEALFADAGKAKARGEASPVYTMAPRVSSVPDRIASVVPDVKLIYLIRNPVERIQSMYVHYVSRGQILSMDEALARVPLYLDASRYALQLDLYLEHFPREQLLVVSSEELRRQREDTMRKILQFLQVEPRVDAAFPLPELNRSVDRRVPTSTYTKLHGLVGRSTLRSLLPTRARRRLRRMLSRPSRPGSFLIPPDLEERIWATLADDLVRLREIVGPDLDLWGRA